jgi:hypothetical protein
LPLNSYDWTSVSQQTWTPYVYIYACVRSFTHLFICSFIDIKQSHPENDNGVLTRDYDGLRMVSWCSSFSIVHVLKASTTEFLIFQEKMQK